MTVATRVWVEFDNERLESTLFDYLWLAATGPNSHARRIAQLQAEAERRGRAELIERARERVAVSVAKRSG